MGFPSFLSLVFFSKVAVLGWLFWCAMLLQEILLILLLGNDSHYGLCLPLSWIEIVYSQFFFLFFLHSLLPQYSAANMSEFELFSFFFFCFSRLPSSCLLIIMSEFHFFHFLSVFSRLPVHVYRQRMSEFEFVFSFLCFPKGFQFMFIVNVCFSVLPQNFTNDSFTISFQSGLKFYLSPRFKHTTISFHITYSRGFHFSRVHTSTITQGWNKPAFSQTNLTNVPASKKNICKCLFFTFLQQSFLFRSSRHKLPLSDERRKQEMKELSAEASLVSGTECVVAPSTSAAPYCSRLPSRALLLLLVLLVIILEVQDRLQLVHNLQKARKETPESRGDVITVLCVVFCWK